MIFFFFTQIQIFQDNLLNPLLANNSIRCKMGTLVRKRFINIFFKSPFVENHIVLSLSQKAFLTFQFPIQLIYTIPKQKVKLNKHTTEPQQIFDDQIGETDKAEKKYKIKKCHSYICICKYCFQFFLAKTNGNLTFYVC